MRVLIVDDAASVRMYHRQILESGGFSVDEADDGYSGLEAAMMDRYRLFIVDVNMPRMDGYSMVRALRDQADNRATPVILVTTETSERERQRAVAAGVNAFLSKPVVPEELLRKARVLTGS